MYRPQARRGKRLTVAYDILRLPRVARPLRAVFFAVLALLLGITTFYRAKKFDYPRMVRATWLERWKAFREASWGLALIVIVVGGIYSGMFTPTEAAAIAAVYSFAISVFVYKDMKIVQVPAGGASGDEPPRKMPCSLPRIWPLRWAAYFSARPPPTTSSPRTLV